MFQGSMTNLKTWNEYTKSKFLDRLKKLGSVYTYQDKTYNILYYNKTDPEHKDNEKDINFDLSYVKPNIHIKMVYDDIITKYKNINEYKFIPIGWSAGCYFALYFAQLYSLQCLHVILLDPALYTPNNMKLRLQNIDKSGINNKPITNTKFKKMLEKLKKINDNVEDMYSINDVCHHIRSNFFKKHLKLELPVPTIAFVNIQKPEKDEWAKDFNNITRLEEVKILKKHNPDNYKAIVMTNKTHYIFNMIQPAKEIIKEIKSIINDKTYMKNYKIIKKLGTGMHGTVYLVKNIKTKKKYAMKVEQVFEKDLDENFKSPIWREIDFAKNMSKKYPQQFMKIYEYENKKCNYIHQLSEEKWKSIEQNKEIEKYYKELFASPFCSIKLTSIVDDMLHNIIYKLDDMKVIQDLFIQVINIAYLINKEGYYHRDLHPKNIGVIYTKDKYIKILDRKVLTHGYILQAIDYGMVLHKKYILEEWESNALKYENDMYQNFYKIIFKIMLKNLIKKYPDVDINKIVPISKKDSKILEPYLENIKVDNSKWSNSNYEYFQELLYKIVFFDKFQEQLNIIDRVVLFEFIPIESIKFIVKNYYNLKKILEHLCGLIY